MIDTYQKRKIAEKILKTFYKRGHIPEYKTFLSLIQNALKNKEFGRPFFYPEGAARGKIVDPTTLKNNVTGIKEDLDTAFGDVKDLMAQEAVVDSEFYGEFQQLRQSLQTLSDNLDTLLLKENYGGSEVLYDNFRNTNKIDLSQTTAYVDTSNGYVTLPISTSTSVRYPSDTMKFSTEKYSVGYKSIGGEFISVFNDYTDQVWQAQLPEGGFYQVSINLTGGDVIAGHANEVEVNRIVVEPVSPITVLIEGSVDNLNWFTLGSASIKTSHVFELEPTWVLYIRFTITGNTTPGIRRIEVSKVGTSDSALLYSTVLNSVSPMYDFNFQVDQTLPYGTTINHYMFTGAEAGWIKILPGPVKLDTAMSISLVFGSSGDIVADNLADPTTAWKYSIPSSASPIVDSGQLWRGVGQFKVDALQFNFETYSDGNHIPDIADWNNDLGLVHSCYMGSAGYTTTDDVPPGIVNENSSFIFNYIRPEQEWWGVCLKSTSGNLLPENYNYKLTTYLYSDRDVLIEDFAGGVYVRDPLNPSHTPSITNINAWGWCVYVNSVRVASDNKFYSIAVPGSGSLVSTQGKTFPVSIKAGWNKIETLIYSPSNGYIDSGLNNFNAFLLFRPNLFSFDLSTQDQYSFAPKISEYPIWADGSTMNRVSEFYLKWNVAPQDKGYWAWRVDATSGVATAVLLNYNPVSDINTTIDGTYVGSNPAFNLKYSYVDNPITTLYYKAELKREQYANQPPKLFSYKFLVTR